MNIFIDDILCSTVESYMEHQWVNKQREIGFYRAREEILSNAAVWFYEPNSVTPIDIWMEAKEGIPERLTPNPVLASSNGIFPDLSIEDGFKMVVLDSDGIVLSTSEVSNGS